MRSTFLAGAAIAAFAMCLPAMAQSDGRRPVNIISGATTVIDEPGHYYLLKDEQVRSGMVLLSITASNVTLDLNGRTLMGPGNRMGNAIRIANATGVRVHNGNIANFHMGIVVTGSNTVTLEHLSIRAQGLAGGAPPELGMMIVQSKNVTVAHNSIFNVALGLFVRGGQSWGNKIVDNNITTTMNGVFGICYNPADGDPMGPRGDLIARNHISGYPVGLSMASTSPWNIIRDNSIFATTMGIDNQNKANLVEMNSVVTTAAGN